MTNYCTKTLMAILVLGLSCSIAVRANQQQAEKQVISALQAAQEPQQQGEESYQRVYEAFTKLISNVSNNSLGNARRLVSRLNQLVGANNNAASTLSQQQQNVDENTEQILNRLDQVNKDTDQHTLRQLQDDVNRLVSTLGDSYLRNIRRLIERVDRVVGQPTKAPNSQSASALLHQSGDRLQDGDSNRPPGFPGWDELIVAVDRMQKSLANFVRSSTKLITSGRR